MRYAVIVSNVIVAAVEWDGVSAWTPPAGAQAVATTLGDIGWTWNNGAPVNPNPPPPPPTPVDYSVIDNQAAPLKALALAIVANTTITLPQLRSAFATAWKSLPGEQLSG